MLFYEGLRGSSRDLHLFHACTPRVLDRLSIYLDKVSGEVARGGARGLVGYTCMKSCGGFTCFRMASASPCLGELSHTAMREGDLEGEESGEGEKGMGMLSGVCGVRWSPCWYLFWGGGWLR